MQRGVVMAGARRAGRSREAGTPTDLAAVAEARAHEAAEAVRAQAMVALGDPPPLAAPPEPVYAGWGPDAHRVVLAIDDTRWAGTLIARPATPERQAREEAAMAAARSLGLPVPETVSAPGAPVLVLREPAGTSLAERMIADLAHLPRLLTLLGELHARLHASPCPPVGGLASAPGHDPGGGGAPVATLLPAEHRAWLHDRRPPPGEAVLCHGELTPVHVYHRDDAPPVPVNWTGAGRGEAEYDVAATLAGFWSAPLYAGSAVQRRLLTLVRESLAASYLEAYRSAASRPPDDRRLRYWEVFHLAVLAAGIARCRARGPAGPWDTAAHVARPDRALDEIRGRVRTLTTS